MTRHGSLAYYLAAWVVGCLIVAFFFLIAGGSLAASTLLVTYFFALIAGLAGLLLFAFLLRLVAHLLGTNRLWVWTLLGALLFPALVLLGNAIFARQPQSWEQGLPLTIGTMIFHGAMAIRQSGFWQAPLDGAATAAVLFLVDRAFSGTTGAQPTDQSAASSGEKRSPA